MISSHVFAVQNMGMELISLSVIANRFRWAAFNQQNSWVIQPKLLQVSWGVKRSRFFLKVPSFYVAKMWAEGLAVVAAEVWHSGSVLREFAGPRC